MRIMPLLVASQPKLLLTGNRFPLIIESTEIDFLTACGVDGREVREGTMAVTIQDIANYLGLAPSTVSKSLNDYPHISSETRQRVLEAAQELGYYPRAAARSLRRGRTDKVGLLINNPLSFLGEYIADIIAGAALTAEQQGNNLVLYTTAVSHPAELKRICRAREVDGLILIFEPSSVAIQVLEHENMPFVVFGRRVEHPDVSFVAPDNQAGAYALTKHLIEQGHQRIGFTTRPQLGAVSQDRFAGYQQALAEANIPFDSDLVMETVIEPLSGHKAMERFLEMVEPPTAVFAFYDLVAVDALHTAQERGLRIPDDIAIAGFDGLRSSRITQPRITTVQQPLAEMGQHAMHALFARITDNTQLPMRQTFPVELIIRQSTYSH